MKRERNIERKREKQKKLEQPYKMIRWFAIIYCVASYVITVHYQSEPESVRR